MSAPELEPVDGLVLHRNASRKSVELTYLDENGEQALVEIGPGAQLLVPADGSLADAVEQSSQIRPA